MKGLLDFFRFASDATLVGLLGGLLLLLALIALFADRRRLRRKHIDAVGWVPWTPIFLMGAVVGVSLLTVAVKSWVAG
jgi:hypothetical protein